MKVIGGVLSAQLLVLVFTHDGWSQGQLVFANNTATRITNLITHTAWEAGPNSKVAIYAAPGSNQPRGTLTVQSEAITNLWAPGLFNGGTRTLGVPVGA